MSEPYHLISYADNCTTLLMLFWCLKHITSHVVMTSEPQPSSCCADVCTTSPVLYWCLNNITYAVLVYEPHHLCCAGVWTTSLVVSWCLNHISYHILMSEPHYLCRTVSEPHLLSCCAGVWTISLVLCWCLNHITCVKLVSEPHQLSCTDVWTTSLLILCWCLNTFNFILVCVQAKSSGLYVACICTSCIKLLFHIECCNSAVDMVSLNILTVRLVCQPLNPSMMKFVHQNFLFSLCMNVFYIHNNIH